MGEQDSYFEFENVGLGSLPAGKDNTQLSQISLERLWNFLANPDTSTRNLYTNILYGLASQILWIIPTFIGKIPEPDERLEERLENEKIISSLHFPPAQDKLGGLKENL